MQYKHSSAGKVLHNIKGYDVFVPFSLPPNIQWTSELVGALSRADFLLGKLSREGSLLPNPHLLMRPFIAREAVLSSKIEGTHATIGEVLAHNAGIHIRHNLEDLQEVQNYIHALDYGINRLKELPLSLRLIKEIHSKLMKGVRGSYATPGEFRKSQNWVGVPGSTINTAKFVPPPIEELPNCLGDLEQFLHYRQLPALIHAAICHYQFEVIHPFLDGNGRVGRVLIILLLIEQKILPTPILYISAFFEATRNEYYDLLLKVSMEGSWNEWLIYFLQGIALQSEDALSRAERINSLLNHWKFKVANTFSQFAVDIIEYIAMNPFITINRIASEFGIAYSTAKRSIEKLESEQIIQQVGNSKRDKVYCAYAILDILEEPAKIYADFT